MKIISNQKKIQRNYKIGLYTSLASLVFLFIAVGLTLAGMNQPLNNTMTTYSFVAMILGLLLSQVGVYFANRFGKSPRIDERITQGLKGLDDRYTLYHYMAPVPHLLTGPSGVWVLVSQYHSGQISFENKRYRQKGVGLFSRLVGQEGLGRPDLEAQAYQEDMEKFLKNHVEGEDVPPVKSVIVFTSPKASVQAAESPLPTLHVDKLKDFLRRATKESPASMKAIQKVQDALPEEDIV
jgi:hypothetical protein